MRTRYGIWAVLAMAAIGVNAAAADTPVPTPAKNTHLAKTRGVSITLVSQTPQPGLSAVTQDVERYFNNLNTLQADFVQTVTGEAQASSGTFYWAKPGKFLWLYKEPVRQKVVSTGSGIYYHDEERNQTTQLPTDAGVARLFNAKTLNLSQQGLRAVSSKSTSRELSVTFAVEKKVAMSDTTGLARLTLVFAKLPQGQLQLKTIDAQDTLSVTTRVDFADVQENLTLVRKLFDFTPGVYQQRN